MPTGDREKDGKLPGMGGAFNSLNLTMYAYGHQNPVKYVDPDGNLVIEVVLNKDRNIAGKIHITDDFGNEVKLSAPTPYRSAAVLGYALHRDTVTSNGDTPTGTYEIKDTVVSSSQNKSSYGPMRIRLDPISGDALSAKENGRTGIDIHGGDSVTLPGRTGLKQTQGCVRVSNENIQLIDNIVKNNRDARNTPAYENQKLMNEILGNSTNQKDILKVREE